MRLALEMVAILVAALGLTWFVITVWQLYEWAGEQIREENENLKRRR